MCRREIFEAALGRMSGQGFKVLLDFLASSPEPPKVKELPYSFRERLHGERSSTDDRVGIRDAARR